MERVLQQHENDVNKMKHILEVKDQLDKKALLEDLHKVEIKQKKIKDTMACWDQQINTN